jgi:hypothetical protein
VNEILPGPNTLAYFALPKLLKMWTIGLAFSSSLVRDRLECLPLKIAQVSLIFASKDRSFLVEWGTKAQA